MALASLLLLVCTGCGLHGCQATQPQQKTYTPPTPTTGLRGTQLNFIPTLGSRVQLKGTATIGSWTSQSAEVYAQVVLDIDAGDLEALFDQIQAPLPNDRAAAQDPQVAFPLRGSPIADVSVPVMSLHGSDRGMDRDLENALHAGQYPAIEYVYQQLQQSTVQRDPHNRQANLILRVLGQLTLAGTQRPIAMDVVVHRDSPGHFIAHAQTTVLMEDFGINPPSALFGLIHAGNKVVVTFDLNLALAHDSPSTRPHQ